METSAARPHATLAQASRERRDVVSGEVMEEARLIRFVAGPDGQVVPDLARKLPGRGIWVAAEHYVYRIDSETHELEAIPMPESAQAVGIAIDEPTDTIWVSLCQSECGDFV